ncbi:hypothetical protein [Erysipelothrix aquatica]|uniref:hypothetical protein n=1 Tax=Erysipelothrix aquatica TaxID=2683714 RepID=UPI0013585A64|nr:hypothetical protein [Erysipelothrix aquatica]
MTNQLSKVITGISYGEPVINENPLWQKIIVGGLLLVGVSVVIVLVITGIEKVVEYFKEQSRANEKITRLNIEVINRFFMNHQYKVSEPVSVYSDTYNSDDHNITFSKYGIHLEDKVNTDWNVFMPLDFIAFIMRESVVVNIELCNDEKISMIYNSPEESKQKMNEIMQALYSISTEEQS